MGGSSHTYDAKIAGIQIQTSLLGAPIPLGWGRARLSCNLIDYVNFVATPHTTSQGGGKGFGGNKSTTYTYTASVIMGLCEGPITGIVSVYKDSSTYTGGSALSQSGLNVALGSTSQAPWSYLTSMAPSHAINYPGIAYVYAQDYALSSSATLANHSFEIDFATQVGGGIYDANPKDIITDILTNPRYGVSGWGTGLISTATFTDYSNYCLANNLLLSPVIDQQVTAKEFIKKIMTASNSDCYWSEGLLKIKPLGDSAATANAVTWNPNLTPIFALNEDSFIGEVQLEIVDQTSAHNMIQIEYLERSNQYQPAVVPASDLDNIVTYGLRKQDPQTMHEICDGSVARHVAQLYLQRHLYIRDIYKFTLPMDFIALEPMDYVTLTTTVDGLQLSNVLVMINDISEDVDGMDLLHITAEGIPGATASTPLYAAHTATGFQPAVTADPGNVGTPFLINAPTALTVNGYEAWAAVWGTNPAWGGANVWVSYDGTNYSQIGSIFAPGTYGTLTTSLASAADPDTTNTLSVDLTSSRGTLATVTHTEADNGATLCLIDSEIVSYGTATLTAANKYDLTYLRRGQRFSLGTSHSAGASFLRLNDAVFKYAYNAANVGKLMYVKFQSFNIYGKQLQDISTLTAYTLGLTPAASYPANANGLGLAGGGSNWTGSAINLVCNAADRATSYRFDIYKADGTTLIRSITSSTNSATYTAAQAQTDGPQREYKISVTSVNAAGASVTSAKIDITNAAPPIVTNALATGGAYSATITCDASTDADLSGYVVFYSTSSSFDPATTGGVVSAGAPSVNIYGLAAGTYFCKIAAFDPWTANPAMLNLSAVLSFTISTGGGSTPSGGGTSGGGYRSACVTDDTLVLMADGSQRPAGKLRVGDVLRTQHEHTLEWGDHEITAISFDVCDVLKAPGFPRATAYHRFYDFDLNRWVKMEDIGTPDGRGIVAKITVADAHTYVSAGVLSHNIKAIP